MAGYDSHITAELFARLIQIGLELSPEEITGLASGLIPDKLAMHFNVLHLMKLDTPLHVTKTPDVTLTDRRKFILVAGLTPEVEDSDLKLLFRNYVTGAEGAIQVHPVDSSCSLVSFQTGAIAAGIMDAYKSPAGLNVGNKKKYIRLMKSLSLLSYNEYEILAKNFVDVSCDSRSLAQLVRRGGPSTAGGVLSVLREGGSNTLSAISRVMEEDGDSDAHAHSPATKKKKL
jgi:hypothetical protein